MHWFISYTWFNWAEINCRIAHNLGILLMNINCFANFFSSILVMSVLISICISDNKAGPVTWEAFSLAKRLFSSSLRWVDLFSHSPTLQGYQHIFPSCKQHCQIYLFSCKTQIELGIIILLTELTADDNNKLINGYQFSFFAYE